MTDTKSESSHGRFLCADALSCLGVMLLLGLQYIRETGFIESTITYDSAPFIAMRWFCLSGAMLLASCVGYVKSSEQFSLHSFKPLFRLSYIYVIATLCTLLLRKVFFEQEMTPDIIFQALRQFSATDTAKFLGMYFALLLAAPFLGAAFQKLQSRNARLAFVVVTAAVSTLQPMLLLSSGDYLLPEWCKMLAPIAGFAGGAYIREYAAKHSRILWLFLLLLVWGGQTACVTYVCTDRGFLYYPQFDSMASLLSLLTALFTLGLFHSPARGESGRHSFFAGASGGALITLMLGDVVIDFLMPSIQENFPELEMLLIVGFFAVLVVFILSCTVGLFLQLPVFLVRAFTGESEYEDDEEYKYNEDNKNQEKINIPDNSNSHNFDMPIPQHKSLRVLEPIPENQDSPVIPEILKNPENPDPVLEIAQRTQKIQTIRDYQKAQRIREQEEEKREELRRIQNQKSRPIRKNPASLQEILREQGIPYETSAADPNSIDELIARITGNE
ncbi:MAG: hypothetical protein K2H29_07010 [Oscillospiraceae bacterium]|nr:hypothetical protein [Oscillospiraceae bacterium]